VAHFAEIDPDNTVLRVIVIGNADTADASGVEKEHIGAAFCERRLGGVWVQTSYNGNIRKNYAGIGFTYDADRDAFIPPQPYPSWAVNEDTCLWEAPVPMPEEGGPYQWNEDTQTWLASAAPGSDPE
jgi:hypothetical protein